jgi:DNA polymerase-3 subunit beta
MYFSVESAQMVTALSQVIGIAEAKGMNPILSNVLLIHEGENLRLVVSDLETELVVSCPLIGSCQDLAVTASAKKMFEIFKSLSGEVRVDLKDQRLQILVEGAEFELTTLPAVDFPELSNVEFESQVKLDSGYLKSMLKKVAFSVGLGDIRPYMSGVLLELSENKLTSVSTDGHRLSITSGEVAYSGAVKPRVIFPRRSLMEFFKSDIQEDQLLQISFSANHIRFEAGQYQLTSKLVNAEFPEYWRIAPKNFKNQMVADKDALKQSLQRAMILSNEKIRGVRLCFKAGRLDINATNTTSEKAMVGMQADYTGDDLEVAFNAVYLLDVLAVLDGEYVSINFSDANNSFMIQDTNDTSSQFVVMPLVL